jgi:hypothetical protein
MLQKYIYSGYLLPENLSTKYTSKSNLVYKAEEVDEFIKQLKKEHEELERW